MKYTNQKMYNGRMITNTINKPLLHKKGKQWIVVGLSALMLAGFGGAIGLGHSTVHADTNTVQTSINKNLAQNNKQSSSASSNNTQNSANASNSNKAISTSTSEVTDQAKNLHANLLANATLAPVTGTNDSANNGQKNNQVNSNKQEEVVSEPEVDNTSGSYDGLNYSSDGQNHFTLNGSVSAASDMFSRWTKVPKSINEHAKSMTFNNVSVGNNDLADMFDGNGGLASLSDVTFNSVQGSISGTKQMFQNLPSLNKVTLGSGFDMSSSANDTNMFGNGTNLNTLVVGPNAHVYLDNKSGIGTALKNNNNSADVKTLSGSMQQIPAGTWNVIRNFDGLNYTVDSNNTVTFTGKFPGSQVSDFFGNGATGGLPSNPVTTATRVVFGSDNTPVDFSNVNNLTDMFNDSKNYNVKEIDFNNVTGMNHVTNMTNMFGGTANSDTNPQLSTIHFGKGFDMSNVTSGANFLTNTGEPLDNNGIQQTSMDVNLQDVGHHVEINIPNTRQGNYQGLHYVYDPNTKTVEFTNGTLTWTNGSTSPANSFIGNQINNSRDYQDLNSAQHIVFEDSVNTDKIYNNNNHSTGGVDFIADDPNVETIDLGDNFKSYESNKEGSTNLSNMFANDSALREVDFPNNFGGWNNSDNTYGMFNNDSNLNTIKIHSRTIYYDPSLKLSPESGLSTTDYWRKGGTNNKYQIGNGSTTLNPGTYIKQSATAANVEADKETGHPYNQNIPISDFTDFIDHYNNGNNRNYQPSHPVAVPDFANDDLTEGSAKVHYDTSNDTITFSDGTLSDNKPTNSDSSLAIPTRIFDHSTNTWVPSDKLPNSDKDWTIRFYKVNAPSDIYFDLDGKNEEESTFETNPGDPNRTIHSKFGQKQEQKSLNFIGNQVSNIDLSGLNTSGTKNMEGFMINNPDLKHVNFGDGSNFDTSNVNDMSMMLGSDVNLPYVDLSSLKGNSLNQAWDMLYNDQKLQGVKLSAQFSPHYGNNSNTCVNGSDAVNLGEMFGSDPSLQFDKINWNGFNTNKVTAFYGMFRSDYNLGKNTSGKITLPSTFDTSNGVNFGHSISQKTHEGSGPDGMFQSDFSSRWNTGVKSINLGPNFDTSNALDVEAMFRADKALKNINFGSKFHTNKVEHMDQMFAYSDGISDLSLPATFDTSNVQTNADMFASDAHQTKNIYSGKLKTITINSKNTKLVSHTPSYPNNAYNSGSDMWGYYSDNHGNIDQSLDSNRFYRVTSRIDQNNEPITLADRHNFSDGSDGSNGENKNDLIGTFTIKDTNPAKKDTDVIDFVTTDGTFVTNESVIGSDGSDFDIDSSQNQKYIPNGYQLANNNVPSDKFVFGQKRSEDYMINNKEVAHVIKLKSGDNNRIPLSDNVADVNGTIDLHFISAQGQQIIPLHYHRQMTANDQPVNLLTLSSDISVSSASSYVGALNSIANGLPTSEYSYASAYSSGSASNTSNTGSTGDSASDYANFRIKPSDAVYYNGSTRMFDGPTLNFYFTANNATNRIKLVDNNGTIVPVAANYDGSNNSEADVSGSYGSSVNTSTAVSADIPSNYSLNSNNPSSLVINNGSDIIHVSRKQATDQINYISSSNSSQTLGSASITGNSGSDIIPDSDDMPDVPSGYHVTPGQSSFAFNGSGESVKVSPNTAHELIEYYDGQTLVGTQLMQGSVGESSHISSGNDHNYNQSSTGYGLDNGYSLATNSTPFSFSDGETVIPVKRNSATNDTTIQFITPEGIDGTPTNVGSATVNNNSRPVSDRITMSDIKNKQNGVNSNNLNSNYHIVNNTDTIPLDGQPHDVIVAPNQVTNTVQYKDGNSDEGSLKVTGLYHTPGHTDGRNMSPDYRLANNGTSDFTFGSDNSTQTVNVVKNQHADSITFVNQHGAVVGHYNTGYGNANSRLANNDAIAANNHIPNGYSDPNANGSSKSITYDGLNHVIDLKGQQVKDNINIDVYTIDADGNKTMVDKNGNKTTSPQTYTIKGNVGDPYSIVPTQEGIQPNGYDVMPSDVAYSGIINEGSVTGLPTTNNGVIQWSYNKPKAGNRSTLVYYQDNSDGNTVISSGGSNESGEPVGTNIDISDIAPVPAGYHLVNSDDIQNKTVQNGQQILYFNIAHNTAKVYVQYTDPNDNTTNGSVITGNTGSLITNLNSDGVPAGYHIIPGQSAYIPNSDQSIDIKIIPNDMSSYVTINRIYKFNNQQVKSVNLEPIPINIEPGQSQTISPNDPNFMMPGFSTKDSDWNIPYQDNPTTYTNMNRTFTYTATLVDIQVQYVNVDDKTSQYPNGIPIRTSDLGSIGVDGQAIDVNADNSTQIGTITGQGIYTKNGTPVTFDVPNGYHLKNNNNIIIVTPELNGYGKAKTNAQGYPVMLLSMPMLGTGTPNKPTSSSADNHNHKPAKPSSSSASSSSSVPNKPAKPASSSASSSNNVPPVPNSNSNGGGSVSPSNNGGGFIPNGGGYVPVPIPYPTPAPASNADNTPHNSTTVLPGSTTNNYYDNDNNTTNNYYNNRSSKSSDFSSNHKIGKANNLRDLNEVGVNHSVYYHGYKITRLNVPARFRWIYIIKTCLAHKDLVNYGDHQYWAVLRPNHRITLRINKVFKTQRGKKTYYNYEVRIGRHNAFVTSYSTYTRNAYYQPTDLRRTRSHGIFHHYYRARLILNNGLYRSRYYTGRTFVRELHRGKIVHIKRIITIGRKGDFQTRFQLTNGDYITSNKNWIKLL